MFEEQESITFNEFKAWLVGLIRGKSGALPDLEDWKQIKKMMDKVKEQEPIVIKEKDFISYPMQPEPYHPEPYRPFMPDPYPYSPVYVGDEFYYTWTSTGTVLDNQLPINEETYNLVEMQPGKTNKELVSPGIGVMVTDDSYMSYSGDNMLDIIKDWI